MISTQQALSLHREAKGIKEKWERGAAPDARAVLAGRPELRGVKSIVLDLAYEEYCLRCNAGHAPDPDLFCDRFPTFRQSVRRMIAAHQLLEEDADALAEAPAVRWPAPGERLADLTLLRVLGRGAFARVYLALEASTGGRPVAVKFSAEGGAEARTMGRLVHPSVVPVLWARFDEEVGLTAVCMPFLGAATLTDLLDQAYPTPGAAPPREAAVIGEAIRSAACSDDPPPLSSGPARRPTNGCYAEAVAGLALQIADALAFLHQEGVVHRDLKPSNVLLRPDGQAVLLDFNLSADARAAGPRLGGTLPYMAPEQLRTLLRWESGDALDGRVDLFALGVMLYELLTGRHPFGAPAAGQPPGQAAPPLLERQRKGCAPLRTFNPAVDRGLAHLVELCLAYDPSDRPASAADLAARLRRHLALPARLQRWAARRPFIAAAAAGLLLLAAGGAASELTTPQLSADVRDYNRGRAAYFDGDYDHAKECFNQAVQDCPNELKPRKYYMARAVAGLRLGETIGDELKARPVFADANEALEQANKQQSDGATMALLGYCNSRAGNHDVAVLWYNQAVEAGFTSAGLYNDRGYSLLQIGKLDEAAKDFESSLQSDPNLQPALVNRALLILRNRNGANPPAITDSMLADVKRAVETPPGSQELYLSAARLFAAAARDGRPGDPNTCAGLTFFCVQKALDAGVDPKEIEKNKTFREVLKAFPDFQTLPAAPPRPGQLKTPTRMVDPAPYLPE